MITEPVFRVILHCSRCNTPFTDDEDDRGTILWTRDQLNEHFPADSGEDDDVQGWLRIGDRVLCFDCWDAADTVEEEPVEKAPLPPAEAAQVLRKQAEYAPVEEVAAAFTEASQASDGWTRVAGSAGAA